MEEKQPRVEEEEYATRRPTENGTHGLGGPDGTTGRKVASERVAAVTFHRKESLSIGDGGKTGGTTEAWRFRPVTGRALFCCPAGAAMP